MQIMCLFAPATKVSVAKIAHGVRQPRGQDLLCILRDLRFQVAGPTHLLAGGIEKRIPSGHLLEGLRPARRGGALLALAADGRENPIKHPIDGSWSEQPKVSNGVLVALQKVLDPTIDELFGRTRDCNQSLRYFFFSPKRDTSLLNFEQYGAVQWAGAWHTGLRTAGSARLN
jgi:hypothetical protein